MEDLDDIEIPLEDLFMGAAADGNVVQVQALIEDGRVDIDFKDGLGQTALSRASNRGHLPLVKWLLEKGAKPNAGGPLHWASMHGHLPVVKHLVMKGADLDATDRWNRTPVDLARRLVNTVQANDQEKMQNSIAVCDYLESMMKVRQCHALVIHLLSMDRYACPHGRRLDGEEDAEACVQEDDETPKKRRVTESSRSSA